MKNANILSAIMAAVTASVCLTSCLMHEDNAIPEGAVEITSEESQAITRMYEEGMTTLDIAEVMMTSEESVEETTAETSAEVSETEVPKETKKHVSSKPARKPAVTKKPDRPSKPTAKKVTSTPATEKKPRVTATATPKPTTKQQPTKKPTATPTPKSTPKPTTKPAPTQTPKPVFKFNKKKENECVKYINEARKAHAAKDKCTWYVPLEITEKNRNRAHIRCNEIVENFSHNSTSNNADWYENIMRGGGSTAKTIVKGWIKSGGHYANLIFGCESKKMSLIYCGVGVLEVENAYENDLCYTYAVYGISGNEKGQTEVPSGYVEPTATPKPVKDESDEKTDETKGGE